METNNTSMPSLSEVIRQKIANVETEKKLSQELYEQSYIVKGLEKNRRKKVKKGLAAAKVELERREKALMDYMRSQKSLYDQFGAYCKASGGEIVHTSQIDFKWNLELLKSLLDAEVSSEVL